jgi:hypothetical protein
MIVKNINRGQVSSKIKRKETQMADKNQNFLETIGLVCSALICIVVPVYLIMFEYIGPILSGCP